MITLSTCQFPTSSSIPSNYEHMRSLIIEAGRNKADAAHFCECALSGYVGADIKNISEIDWDVLLKYSEKLRELAKENNIWIIFGSTHRLGKNKPLNSLYVIDANGNLADRYDKRFCAGDIDGKYGDLAHYSSGNDFVTFVINDVKFGLQICHDYRYPEMYREYQQLGVHVMLHSYHATFADKSAIEENAANMGSTTWSNSTLTYPGITMPATMISYAANNYMWISCPNSGAYESCWGSFVVRPDGIIESQLKRGDTGMIVTEINHAKKYYDSTKAWRDRSISKNYHSGAELVHEDRIVAKSSF